MARLKRDGAKCESLTRAGFPCPAFAVIKPASDGKRFCIRPHTDPEIQEKARRATILGGHLSKTTSKLARLPVPEVPLHGGPLEILTATEHVMGMLLRKEITAQQANSFFNGARTAGQLFAIAKVLARPVPGEEQRPVVLDHDKTRGTYKLQFTFQAGAEAVEARAEQEEPKG